MKNIVLEIIVIDIFSIGGFPSKRQLKISIINQGALSSVILVLFWYCSGYIIVSMQFL
jgi:hypothetical protein